MSGKRKSFPLSLLAGGKENFVFQRTKPTPVVNYCTFCTISFTLYKAYEHMYNLQGGFCCMKTLNKVVTSYGL